MTVRQLLEEQETAKRVEPERVNVIVEPFEAEPVKVNVIIEPQPEVEPIIVNVKTEDAEPEKAEPEADDTALAPTWLSLEEHNSDALRSFVSACYDLVGLNQHELKKAREVFKQCIREAEKKEAQRIAREMAA
jgi:hypothetical protein